MTLDGLPLLALRLHSGLVSGLVTGLIAAWPLVIVPALFSAPHPSKLRLHAWSSLHDRATLANAHLMPLLTASLALSALVARSAASDLGSATQDAAHGLRFVPLIVQSNRRALFIVAASLALALRPYSFGVLAPRVEALKAEERRLVLLRLERSGGHDRALGTQGWRGASPVDEYSSWLRTEEQDGNESDVEDNEERSAEGKEGQAGVGTAPIDTDALILDLARWQLGAAIIAGASFFLTLLELVCV
ncbi:uncharacterized protein JCM10292_000682 [Rhodotorula paludigena]|uniref:uncharacterized protein n=1 Tax=Rhodotorula paludigena TaxID=86838 RepID=UPI0031709C64